MKNHQARAILLWFLFFVKCFFLSRLCQVFMGFFSSSFFMPFLQGGLVVGFVVPGLVARHDRQTHERRSTRCTCRSLRSALVRLACCARPDTRHASSRVTPIGSSQLTLKQCSSGTDLSTGTSRLTLFGNVFRSCLQHLPGIIQMPF